MSGHNKWSKIKRKKGVLDSKRSKVFSKHARLIASEVKRANGDTSSAIVLAAVERAKADSMPNENIERALQKGSTDGVVMDEVVFEAFGPGGSALIIVAQTDNNNRTSQEIKHLFSKEGYVLGSPGSASWAFLKANGQYTPTAPLTLSDEDGEKLANLIEILEDHDDVQDVFTSADEPDSV